MEYTLADLTELEKSRHVMDNSLAVLIEGMLTAIHGLNARLEKLERELDN